MREAQTRSRAMGGRSNLSNVGLTWLDGERQQVPGHVLLGVCRPVLTGSSINDLQMVYTKYSRSSTSRSIEPSGNGHPHITTWSFLNTGLYSALIRSKKNVSNQHQILRCARSTATEGVMWFPFWLIGGEVTFQNNRSAESSHPFPQTLVTREQCNGKCKTDPILFMRHLVQSPGSGTGHQPYKNLR